MTQRIEDSYPDPRARKCVQQYIDAMRAIQKEMEETCENRCEIVVRLGELLKQL